MKNVWKLFRGQTLNTPPLGSMTLDADDVYIAYRLLRNRRNWQNEKLLTEFEESFAKWNGSRSAFGFMSGREALSACIEAIGLVPGDEVLVPGYTCVVVPNAFSFAKIKISYCDIELDTYGLDFSSLVNVITPQTKAILLHHLYGLVCRDYIRILEYAKDHKIKVIEDCAQSTGAVFQGRKVGTFGDVGFYSTEQSKVLTTIQGGIAVTDDVEIANRLKRIQASFLLPSDEHVERQLRCVARGYYCNKHRFRWLTADLAKIIWKNDTLTSTTLAEEKGIKPSYYGRRMHPAIAAIASNQLAKIDSYNQSRRESALVWDRWCENQGYRKPQITKDSIPVYLRYPVLVEPEKKSNPQWALNELGVTLGVWFTGQLHPVTEEIPGCHNALQAVSSCINFPTILK